MKKIIVKTESLDLWWGVYGLSSKAGWEDLELSFDSGERIGSVCLNTKTYLRNALEDLTGDENEKDFCLAVQKYLSDNVCHYWFYYDDPEDKDYKEVSYNAPRNSNGMKPGFIDIWHPDEEIDLKTIETAIQAFDRDFLEIEDCFVEIVKDVPFDEAIRSFKDHLIRFGGDTKIEFSDELISELSKSWKIEKYEVVKKLNVSI